MRLFKLTTLAAALCAAIPAHAADTALAEVLIQSDRDDFAARQDARSTKLVYGREELDRMDEMTTPAWQIDNHSHFIKDKQY